MTLFFHTRVLRSQLTNLIFQGGQLQVISGVASLNTILAISMLKGGTPDRLVRTEPLTKMGHQPRWFSAGTSNVLGYLHLCEQVHLKSNLKQKAPGIISQDQNQTSKSFNFMAS